MRFTDNAALQSIILQRLPLLLTLTPTVTVTYLPSCTIDDLNVPYALALYESN